MSIQPNNGIVKTVGFTSGRDMSGQYKPPATLPFRGTPEDIADLKPIRGKRATVPFADEYTKIPEDLDLKMYPDIRLHKRLTDLDMLAAPDEIKEARARIWEGREGELEGETDEIVLPIRADGRKKLNIEKINESRVGVWREEELEEETDSMPVSTEPPDEPPLAVDSGGGEGDDDDSRPPQVRIDMEATISMEDGTAIVIAVQSQMEHSEMKLGAAALAEKMLGMLIPDSFTKPVVIFRRS